MDDGYDVREPAGGCIAMVSTIAMAIWIAGILVASAFGDLSPATLAVFSLAVLGLALLAFRRCRRRPKRVLIGADAHGIRIPRRLWINDDPDWLQYAWSVVGDIAAHANGGYGGDGHSIAITVDLREADRRLLMSRHGGFPRDPEGRVQLNVPFAGSMSRARAEARTLESLRARWAVSSPVGGHNRGTYTAP
ncbi:hypothetical protein V3391_13170 [Luteimonas sp. SMYT11W]|uniref:DUF2244 domain-containing protein n=1 Tax=Luteimonas flava TaxID=3115822 RepID=A0ABU7WGQ7_9GAMM